MENIAYYKAFETRKPYSALTLTLGRILLFQFFSVLFLAVSANYLLWRWFYSINADALWFSLPLVIAESFMFLGSVLMVVTHWNNKTIPVTSPVRNLSEINGRNVLVEIDRPISIDIFIATYNEESTIIEDTIKDAKKIKYPFSDVKINIYLCDDGRRDGRTAGKENFKKLAERYEINYLVRENNSGYKAGNLNHAFWQTEGDLIVILDADTRVFPNFLSHLTGYFRDSKMAWVQSPQWFYDIPEGVKLSCWLKTKFNKAGNFVSKLIPFSDKLNVGRDIFGTDPRLFYDSVLRHRSSGNAAFCCGAGSMHRRLALENLIAHQSKRLVELTSVLSFDQEKVKNKPLLASLQLGDKIAGPFVHHISEDIYTSILMHAEKAKWKSYQHPNVECRMLSPQSLQSYIKQFSRYAEGTFQVFFSRENPFLKKGLSLFQRFCYFETVFSYFSPFWILIFLFSPIIFFFTLTPPIRAFNFDFFLRFLTFYLLNIIITTIGNWGLSTKRSEQYYIGGFWFKMRSLFRVLSGAKLKFNPTVKGFQKNTLRTNIKYVLPHLIIILLTIAGFIYNLVLIVKNLHPSYSAFFANSIWAFYNIYQMNPIIRAAFRKPLVNA